MNSPSTIPVPAKILRLIAPVPSELADALRRDVYLRPAFDNLSSVQRNCYAEWVNGTVNPDERKSRAQLVCSVVRVLAS